jgi:hypothetical protein
MNRYRAGLVHFAISLSVAFLVFVVIRLLWYPGPLFERGGGFDLLLVIITVDVTVGPLLTLIVFVPGKRGLRFDLTTIVVLQLAALAYGWYALVESRPVWIVFVKDRFELVRAIDIEDADRAKAAAEFQALSWTGPRYVGALMPRNPKEQLRLMDSAILGGKDIQTYPEYYAPYRDVAPLARAKAKPIGELRKLNPGADATIDSHVAGTGRPEADVAFLPMRAGKMDLTVLLDAQSGEPLALAPLRPWEY